MVDLTSSEGCSILLENFFFLLNKWIGRGQGRRIDIPLDGKFGIVVGQ